MSYIKLHDTDLKIKLKSKPYSTASSTVKDYHNTTGVEGEPLYATDTGELYIHNGTEYVPLITNRTPSSATDTGIKGQVAWDSSYIYVCVSDDVWKRTALSSW